MKKNICFLFALTFLISSLIGIELFIKNDIDRNDVSMILSSEENHYPAT